MNLHSSMSKIASEQLVMLGKTAAHTAETSGMSLTDAVVRAIGMTKLNSEQVRRVVEAANHEAFHRKFASMDPSMRVVELDGGPADPEAVIDRLHAAALPQKVAMQTSDYSLPPQPAPFTSRYVPEMTKEAALRPVVELRSELRASHEELSGALAARQYDVEEAVQKLAHSARQAASFGAYHEDIERAWGVVSPKLATEMLGALNLPRAPLGVKVASRRLVETSEVVQDFKKFAQAAAAYELAREAVLSMEQEILRVETFLGGVQA